MTRILADRLQQHFGPRSLVENITGAGGNTGADRVSRSDPDGSSVWSSSEDAAMTGMSAVAPLSEAERTSLEPTTDLSPVQLGSAGVTSWLRSLAFTPFLAGRAVTPQHKTPSPFEIVLSPS